MKRFPRGSEWRKWDLHVHIPGTKLSNGYDLKDGELDWDRFCKIIHDSDVYAVGITDYFTIDGFFTFKKHYEALYPDCEKVFFPNLELRLNEAVNGSTEVVDFHAIFRLDLTHKQANEFLVALKTQNTNAEGKKQSCANLETAADFSNATVSRDDIKSALKGTFGEESCWKDHVILIAAANNNGIRADKKSMRKMNLADEIDKFANAFFGNQSNIEYFLKSDRYENPEQKSVPKPVFSGCDAHNFDDLESWLGKEIIDEKNNKYVTWVKADLSYEGLQQTLIEPAERARIQSATPDEKEPYRVISKITFKDEPDFPKEVVFNAGLNAIIGSRSSGKSSLLAYIAHAIDPKYTVQQQVTATGSKDNEVGPGASITWDDVKDLRYEVEWAASAATSGQVIYIPQNSLFAISERPEDVTTKIRPVVFRNDLGFETKFNKALSDIEIKSESIRDAIAKWFSLGSEIKTLADEIRSFGDSKAIANRRDELSEKIRILRESSSLTVNEVKLYQQVAETIEKNKSQLHDIEKELQDLSPYVILGSEKVEYVTTDQVTANISINPSPSNMPNELKSKLQSLIDIARASLLDGISSTLTGYRAMLDSKYIELSESSKKIQGDSKELIDKNLANAQISPLLKALNEQNTALIAIEKKNTTTAEKVVVQQELLTSIRDDIKARDSILETLAVDFNEAAYTLEDMSFSMEFDFNPDTIEQVSSGFNKNSASPYINNSFIDLNKVFSDSGAFINHMASGTQKLNRGENAISLTKNVLTTTKEVRFVAEMEGDHIGGFGKSSMTPGKQALFALTLILADSDELWPLLIDQPEDDLDSRSICDVIVKDLMKRKRERQIIMVTHNANLAIGADSEEIIVANRHGDDRPNANGQLFAYLTGSLEYSKPWDYSVKFILNSAGIREHACEILDGGVEAFQKRKDKYRI
jgi:energy-coupling factor transporter ATP-binding protein EcfA2